MHTAAVLPGKPRAVQELVNVQGTVNVINAAHANGVTKLVFTSSASVVYGGKDQAGVDETEKYPAVPFDDYNDTKAIAESKVLAANGTDGLYTCSLRPAGIFGPKDVKGPVPAMMNMAAKGNSHVQLGSNTNLYDWTYVTNIADAHLLAADRLSPTHPKHALVAGQAFFISNGDPRPWWDFPRMLWRAGGFVETRRRVVIPRPVALVIAFLAEVVGWITGKEPTLTRFRIHYICTERWCNISKAREALDYEPRVSLEEGARISAEVRISRIEVLHDTDPSCAVVEKPAIYIGDVLPFKMSLV